MKPGAIVFACVTSAASLLACGGERPAQSTVTPADVIAGTAVSWERFDSEGGRFTVNLPPVWHGNYTVREGPDTLAGSRFRVEFEFRPDPAWKVEPKPLMAVRIFSKASWATVLARPGRTVAQRITEKGDDVFALSIPESNPYKPGTPEAKRYDDLILSVVQDKAGLRLTPK